MNNVLSKRFLSMTSISMICLFLSVSSLLKGQDVSPATIAATEFHASQLLYYAPVEVDEHKQAALNQIISVDLEEVTLEDALNYIANKGNFRLAYSKDIELVKWNKTVSLQLNEATVLGALYAALGDTGMKLTISSSRNNLLVVTQDEQGGLISEKAQDQIVRGRITDAETGEPLPGVNIIIQGTSIGATTDREGNFEILVQDPNEAVLVFSYIGYQGVEIAVEGQTNIDVTLSLDDSDLGEMVVIGYGVEQRNRLTGSVGRIESSSLEQSVGTLSPEQSIQGRVSGVNVTSSSGMPGAGLRLDVRGAATITGSNEPLYVVDGIPVDGGSGQHFGYGAANLSALSHINERDIESISILKDAAATAIYGSRASNGVVLITTKSGTAGPTQINISSTVGFENVPKRVNLVDSDTWFEVAEEARQNFNRDRGYTPSDFGYVWPENDPRGPNHQDTDWFEELTRARALLNKYDLSISGGDESTRFYGSGSYTGHEGIILTNQFSRLAGRMNVEHQATERLLIGGRVNLSRTVNNRVQNEGDGRGIFTRGLEQRPFDSPYKEDGSYNIGGVDIPLHNGVQVLNEQHNEHTNYRGVFGLDATFNILDGLDYQGSMGGDFRLSHEYIYRNENHPRGGPAGQVFDWRTITQNYNIDNTFTYNTMLTEDLNFSGLIGHTYTRFINEPSSIVGNGFPSPSFGLITSASSIHSASTSWTSYEMESYLTRLNLDYNNRYTLSATIRRDGSSRFPEANRFGYFPSVSGGWRISEEAFLNDMDVLSNLRLRVSYGITGSQSGIGNFSAIPTSTGGYNYRGNTGLSITSVGNPDLKWETARQLNLALDFGFIDDRINVTTEYFNQDTNDLLYSTPLRSTTGFTTYTQNIGSLNNRGFEFEVSTINVQNRSVSWFSDFNISFNRNKIVSLVGEDPIPVGHHVIQEGEALGTFYMVRQIGIYQSDDDVPLPLYNKGVRAGDIEFEDLNGDGDITSADRQIVGTANPDFFGGFSNTISFGNFDLNANFSFRYGNKVYNSWAATLDGFGARYPLMSMRADNVHDRWTEQNTDTDIPRAVIGNHNTQISTRFLEDGSFLRLQNITLGYSLPQEVIGRMSVRSLRLSASAKNLFTITGYSGMDPEVSTSLSASTIGVDRYNVPQMRAFTFSVDVGF